MTLREGRDGLAILDRNTPLHLLLIEDSLADSELVMAMLEDEFPRADVQVETTLDDALDQLSRQRFDLVLADLSLPDAEGAPVVRAVRSTHPETALMVLTGRVDGDLALWALAEGAQDYLVKGQHDGARLADAMLHAVQRKRAEEEAHRYLELARGLLDALEAPTCAIDGDSTIVAVNRAWRDFAEQNGGSAELCGVGVSYLAACGPVRTEGASLEARGAEFVAQGVRDVLAGSVDRFHHEYSCHSPSENRWFSVRVTPADINQRRGAVITHVDITDMCQIQESMARQTLHDTLTDLPNRVLMLDRLGQALSDADRRGLGVAVTQLDLHRFKLVNDRLGYSGGDAVLAGVAERLTGQLSSADTMARSSGDEFMVVWRDLDRDRPEVAMSRSKSLLDSLDDAFEVGGRSVSLSANAGVAWHTPGQGVDDLLKAADAAVHEAKSRGPGQVVLFTDELRAMGREKNDVAGELRRALAGTVDQFVLQYQPIVNLTSGQVVAVEALVRWQHPVKGLLGPDRFIPIAEATGLIHPLGDWVLSQALSDAASFMHDGRELDVAVNVSARQLDDQIVDKVHTALESSGLRPSRCILEVTESAFVKDEPTTAATLEGLSRLGVQLAIDDFGTGYSSLTHLARLPVDQLKVDKSFIEQLRHGNQDGVLVSTFLATAQGMRLLTVAEGVEDAHQAAWLHRAGCDLGQGFLWSRPVDLATARELPKSLSRHVIDAEIPAGV